MEEAKGETFFWNELKANFIKAFNFIPEDKQLVELAQQIKHFIQPTETHPLHTEHSHSPSTKSHEPCYQSDQSDTMAPKLTRAAAKANEFQTEDTPLVQRLKHIKNAKVQEGPFQKLWAEIQDWAYEGSKMT